MKGLKAPGKQSKQLAFSVHLIFKFSYANLARLTVPNANNFLVQTTFTLFSFETDPLGHFYSHTSFTQWKKRIA